MKGIGGKGGKDGAIFSPEYKLIIRTITKKHEAKSELNCSIEFGTFN